LDDAARFNSTMPTSSTHQPIGAAHDARSRASIAASELQTLSRVLSENRLPLFGTRFNQTLSRVFSENRSPLFGTRFNRFYRASPALSAFLKVQKNTQSSCAG